MPFLTSTKELRDSYRSEFYSWQLMWIRTSYKSSRDWEFYGARGIFVEDATWSDFGTFLLAVGPKPEPKNKFCLSRIDKTKGYFLGNVAWRDRHDTVENFRHYGRKQTHCKRGHLLSADNRVRSSSRACLKCSQMTRDFRSSKKQRKTEFRSSHCEPHTELETLSKE